MKKTVCRKCKYLLFFAGALIFTFIFLPRPDFQFSSDCSSGISCQRQGWQLKEPLFFLILRALRSNNLSLPDTREKNVSSPSPVTSKYTCPSSAYIDCMPGVYFVRPQCTKEYLDWIRVNCPNFKGVAY